VADLTTTHHSEYPNAKDEEPQIVLCVERNSNESHVIAWWRTRLVTSDRGAQQRHKLPTRSELHGRGVLKVIQS
jgi:hypothetical protein